MSYRTDMVEQILTSEEGQTILEYLSPIYGQSYAGLWLLQVIGMQLDKANRWSAELALQVTPETATWTIELWEKEYGIVQNPTLTIEQRRAQVMAKIMERLAVTPYRIEQMIQGVYGVPCEVRENTDGVNTSANEFLVVIRKWIDNETVENIRNLVTNIKPAHLIFSIAIIPLVEATDNLHIGVGTTMKQTFEVRVVQ